MKSDMLVKERPSSSNGYVSDEIAGQSSAGRFYRYLGVVCEKKLRF